MQTWQRLLSSVFRGFFSRGNVIQCWEEEKASVFKMWKFLKKDKIPCFCCNNTATEMTSTFLSDPIGLPSRWRPTKGFPDGVAQTTTRWGHRRCCEERRRGRFTLLSQEPWRCDHWSPPTQHLHSGCGLQINPRHSSSRANRYHRASQILVSENATLGF